MAAGIGTQKSKDSLGSKKWDRMLMGKLTLDGMPNHPDISSKEASNALAYSYWFGTFVVRGPSHLAS